MLTVSFAIEFLARDDGQDETRIHLGDQWRQRVHVANFRGTNIGAQLGGLKVIEGGRGFHVNIHVLHIDIVQNEGSHPFCQSSNPKELAQVAQTNGSFTVDDKPVVVRIQIVQHVPDQSSGIFVDLDRPFLLDTAIAEHSREELAALSSIPTQQLLVHVVLGDPASGNAFDGHGPITLALGWLQSPTGEFTAIDARRAFRGARLRKTVHVTVGIVVVTVGKGHQGRIQAVSEATADAASNRNRVVAVGEGKFQIILQMKGMVDLDVMHESAGARIRRNVVIFREFRRSRIADWLEGTAVVAAGFSQGNMVTEFQGIMLTPVERSVTTELQRTMITYFQSTVSAPSREI